MYESTKHKKFNLLTLLFLFIITINIQSGLKKSGGSGGSEHVVYTGDISKQGWQRRYTWPKYQNYLEKLIPKSFIDSQSIQTITPTIPQPQLQHHADEDLAYRGHPAMTSYDGV